MTKKKTKTQRDPWALPIETLRTPRDYDFARVTIDALLDVRAGTFDPRAQSATPDQYVVSGPADPTSVGTIFASVLADVLMTFHMGDAEAGKTDWHLGLYEMQPDTLEYQSERRKGERE